MYFSTLSPYILGNYQKESSAIFAAGQISFIAGYFLSGYLSDRLRRIRVLMVVSIVLHAPAQYMLFESKNNPAAALAYNCAIRFLLAFDMHMINIAVLESQGTMRYAGIRTWGTLGFFLAQILLFFFESVPQMTGWIGSSRAEFYGKLGSVFVLLTAVPAMFSPARRVSGEEYFFADVLAILRKGQVLLFFFASFIFYFSYQLIDYYLGRFLQQAGGMSMVYAGWALAVVFELPFLPMTSRITKSRGMKLLFQISILAGCIRFAWISLYIYGYSPAPLIFSQLLHGIQYTGFFMGTMFWLRRIFPDHLFGTGNGAHMILAVAFGGIAGNLFYGRLLFTGWMNFFGNVPSGRLTRPEDFLPLFFSAMLLQLIVLICFVYLRDPEDAAA